MAFHTETIEREGGYGTWNSMVDLTFEIHVYTFAWAKKIVMAIKKVVQLLWVKPCLC